MTGIERADAADPALMLAFLRDKASDRKLRLFACACCRLLWRHLTEDVGRARVEAVERRLERRTAVPPRRYGSAPTPQHGDSPALYTEVASIFAGCDDAFAAALVTSAMAERADPVGAGRDAQVALMADIFGRPTRPIDRRWRTPEVQARAQIIYDRRRFQELPDLADLIEASGLPPHNALDHFRSVGPHVRGCWALDLLLGKV